MKFEVKGIGVVRIRHEVPGEPVSQPERLEVFMTCANSKTEFRLKIYRFCNWEDYKFDREEKTLNFKFAAGRVVPDTGEVVCDQFDSEQIELESACSAHK